MIVENARMRLRLRELLSRTPGAQSWLQNILGSTLNSPPGALLEALLGTLLTGRCVGAVPATWDPIKHDASFDP